MLTDVPIVARNLYRKTHPALPRIALGAVVATDFIKLSEVPPLFQIDAPSV